MRRPPSRLPDDRARVAEILDRAASLAQDHLARIDTAPVIPERPPPGQTDLGEPVGALGAMEEFASRWLPTMVSSAGPRFQGYVTGGATPAAVAGDWLTSALDQNVASDEGGAAALERQTVVWLRDLLGLPADHDGAMVTGTTMANFTGLALARQWAGAELGVSVDQDGGGGLHDLRVLAGTPHSSILKCLSMLGMGRRALQPVRTLAGREAVDLDALARSVVEAPGPVIVVASAGTVNTGDTDDLQGIVELRESHPFWLHVDGAFGSFATLDERVAHDLAGLGRADSIAVDLHKWMNVPYDSAVLFTRHRQLQTEVFHNSAGYLSTAGREPEFLHLVPENSRRFRALPVWHSLVAYGRDGLTEVVRRCNDHARRFAAGLETVPGVAVLAPVRLNIVCFDAAVPPQTLTDALARSGKGFLTTTTYLGRPGVRAAFSNWRTTDEDVDLLVDAVATIVSGDSA